MRLTMVLRVYILAALLFCMVIAAPDPAVAQPIATVGVSFAPGTSGTEIQGSVKGYEVVDYVLGASAGHRMVVDMTTSNASSYFNIKPSDTETGIFTGSIDGLHFNGILPSGGDWVIRVYLMRNAARRNEVADYTLDVSIDADGAAGVADFADREAGGPDWWQVTRASTLNVRAGPGSGEAVIGKAANGQMLRNLGCKGQGADRWCHVEVDDGASRGWVSGGYLREGAMPHAGGTGTEIRSRDPETPDLYFRPSGEIEAGWSEGCTVLYNPSGARINAGSSCSDAQLNASDLSVERMKN